MQFETKKIITVTGWPQPAAKDSHSWSLTVPTPQWDGQKIGRKVVVQGTDREITYQLQSWLKKTQLGKFNLIH